MADFIDKDMAGRIEQEVNKRMEELQKKSELASSLVDEFFAKLKSNGFDSDQVLHICSFLTVKQMAEQSVAPFNFILILQKRYDDYLMLHLTELEKKSDPEAYARKMNEQKNGDDLANMLSASKVM